MTPISKQQLLALSILGITEDTINGDPKVYIDGITLEQLQKLEDIDLIDRTHSGDYYIPHIGRFMNFMENQGKHLTVGGCVRLQPFYHEFQLELFNIRNTSIKPKHIKALENFCFYNEADFFDKEQGIWDGGDG